MPIALSPLSGGGVNPGITYNPIFEEWEAGTAAGLDMYTWEQGGYPSWLMARAMVWHRSHRLIDTHVEDARNAKMARKGKK